MRVIKTFFALVVTAGVLAGSLWAQDIRAPEPARLAALALPFGQRADWRQWDSFLTHIVKVLPLEFGADQREQVADVFLDARHQLVQALSSGSSDPVPRLLIDTWARLSPLLKQWIPSLSQQNASRFSSFVTAMEAMTSLTAIGQQLGFVRITPETLRGAAGFLGKTDVDPLAYNLDIDADLRTLLGFTATLPTPRPSRLLEQGRFPAPLGSRASILWRIFWDPRGAHAAEADYSRLNEWVPDDRELEDYLEQVRDLLEETHRNVAGESNLAAEFRELFRQILLATAWQESCWRQFVKKGQKLAPLSSVTGDVGLMQVNRHVWRGLYDLKGLAGDIEYNGHAGAEILLRYLTRYALRKNEHKQPGGQLARATYAVYNGGPSHLMRYRDKDTNPNLKTVDDAFWQKFQAVSSGQELAVKSCYGL